MDALYSYYTQVLCSNEVTTASALFKLLLSALLGGAIGFERKRKGQIAGSRTFALIAMGATLAMLVSAAIPQLYATDTNTDPARVAAQVISGIGFLGAGAIIVRCHHEQDIWKMGGLAKRMPLTSLCFLMGTFALIAIPGFSVLQQISCHQDPIQCLSLSSDGKLLTTASDKGTLIRVFDVQDGNKSSEFRRGFRASAVTAVDTDNDITCACTATTLHVFTRAHITSPLSHPPLALNVIDGDVWLVTTDGILTIYKVDRAGAKLVLQNQQKLSELSITDESKKLKRRTTI